MHRGRPLMFRLISLELARSSVANVKQHALSSNRKEKLLFARENRLIRVRKPRSERDRTRPRTRSESWTRLVRMRVRARARPRLIHLWYPMSNTRSVFSFAVNNVDWRGLGRIRGGRGAQGETVIRKSSRRVKSDGAKEA